MGSGPKDNKSIFEKLISLVPVFERDEVEAIKTGDKIGLRFKQGKIRQNAKNRDTIEEVNSALVDKHAVAELQEFLRSRGFEETVIKEEKKRVYRRKADLPNPEKSRWAAENRVNFNPTKKQINLRLDPQLLKIVEEAAEKSGLNRTSWMTAAFIRAAREEGFDVPSDLEPTPDGPS